jgi:hypothetical protein
VEVSRSALRSSADMLSIPGAFLFFMFLKAHLISSFIGISKEVDKHLRDEQGLEQEKEQWNRFSFSITSWSNLLSGIPTFTFCL